MVTDLLLPSFPIVMQALVTRTSQRIEEARMQMADTKTPKSGRWRRHLHEIRCCPALLLRLNPDQVFIQLVRWQLACTRPRLARFLVLCDSTSHCRLLMSKQNLHEPISCCTIQ